MECPIPVLPFSHYVKVLIKVELYFKCFMHQLFDSCSNKTINGQKAKSLVTEYIQQDHLNSRGLPYRPVNINENKVFVKYGPLGA